jgi:hypothetical protein
MILAAAAATSSLSGFSPGTFGARIGYGAVLAGTVWLFFVLGFRPWGASPSLYPAPAVESGVPIIWPANALLIRSEPVRRDLERRMADPQSTYILFLILGGAGIALGLVAFASAILGVLAISMVATAVAVLPLATRPKGLHRRNPSTRS